MTGDGKSSLVEMNDASPGIIPPAVQMKTGAGQMLNRG